MWGSSISLITAGSRALTKKRGSESKEERKKERKKEKEKEGMAWNGREGLGFTIWALPNLGIPQFWRVVFCFSERPFCT